MTRKVSVKKTSLFIYTTASNYFMRTYLADIIPKIQRFSQKLDNLTKLTNQHWVSLGDINESKRVYIFRTNNQLLISDNGIVEKGSWEYLGNQSILLETIEESYLLKNGFFDENVIALKLDSTNNYAFFVNETKYHKELNNIEDILSFLENKYLNKNPTAGLGNNRKGSITEGNDKFDYEIINETENYDFVWGNYTTIEIKFLPEKIDKVYKGKSTGKYFYFDLTFGKIYCDNFKDVMYKLFLYNKKSNY